MNYLIDEREMAAYREEEDPFEEDIVFDQAGLLNSTSKMNTAIRRVSSGKCVLFAKTLGLCGAFFGLGLCIAIPGPTFLSPFHPLVELDSSVSPVSSVFVSRTSGYVIGSIIGGVLFDRFNRLFLLFLSLLLTAILITVTPWCQAVVLEICMIILGITMGFLDTGGNVLCLDLWGRNSGPFMQALHFSFGLGAFVAPLLAAPFLGSPLANTSLNTEFSHVITEFPVHLQDSKDISFQKGRLRREIESMREISDLVSGISKNASDSSFLIDNSVNVTDVTASPLLFSPSSTFSLDFHSESLFSSTQSTSAKPRVPKRKPSKTDASKLGNKNWDKVHVGIPPASDLLPLTTSSTLPPSPSQAPTQLFSSGTVATESYTSDTQDVSTSASTLFSTSTTTETNTPMSTTSSGMSVEHVTPLHNTNESTNSPSGTADITSSSSATSTSSPSIFMPPPKVLSSVEASRDAAVDGTSFLKNQSSTSLYDSEHGMKPYKPKDNNNAEFKEFDEVKNKQNNFENGIIFPRRNENSSEMPVVPVLPLEKSLDESNTEYVRENALPNSLLLKSGSQNFSSSSRNGDNMDSLVHTMHSPFRDTQDSPFSHSPVEKAINASSDSTEDSHLSFALKSNVESISSQKSENPITLDPVPVMTQQLGDDVSDSPLGILSTTVPVLGHTHHVHHKPGTFDNDTEHINTIFDIFANRIEKYGFNKIQFTYLIVGIFVFLISLVFLGFLCHNPRDPKSKQEGLGGKKITNKIIHRLLVALMALFFFLYMGMEVAYGHLILTFSTHSNLQLSVVFWGSFAAMRFASIFFASGFSPLTMLLLNFAFCTSGTILVSFLANHFDTALWVGTALVGIGLASMLPTGILWIERYIHVSNKVAAIFVIGVALGELICPVTIYKLMAIERMLFMYAALVINIICILIFILLWWLASHQGEKYSVINSNGYQLANQHDEEEDMMDMSPSGSGVVQKRHCFSSEHRSLLNGNIHRGP